MAALPVTSPGALQTRRTSPESSTCLQASSSNLFIELRGKLAEELQHLKESRAAELQDIDVNMTTQIAGRLFQRTTNFLVSAQSTLGHIKVQAFQLLLQRSKFWAASFGVCGDVALAVLYPQHATPLSQQAGTSWAQAPYEMWHLCR